MIVSPLSFSFSFCGCSYSKRCPLRAVLPDPGHPATNVGHLQWRFVTSLCQCQSGTGKREREREREREIEIKLVNVVVICVGFVDPMCFSNCYKHHFIEDKTLNFMCIDKCPPPSSVRTLGSLSLPYTRTHVHTYTLYTHQQKLCSFSLCLVLQSACISSLEGLGRPPCVHVHLHVC